MSQNIERSVVAVPRTQKVTNPHLDMDADIESDSCKSITDSETHPDAHLAPVPLHHDEENESRGTKDGSTSVAGTVPMTKSSTLLSKITTVQIDDSLIVPSNQRRGLFARLCLIPEYQDSRNMPASLRRFIVFIIAFCAMLGPMGTSILLPASDNAVADLHTTITILNVAIGVYLITLGVIPLWWSNFSERHGRRSVYIISFIMYLGFTVGCALSKDVNKLIGFRVLSGGCAASVQSVGAGTIGDLYPITKRGSAMGLFYLGPLAGPLLSPIIGGAITSNKKFGWRATQWFLVCLSFGCCLLIVFFLPETLRKQDNRESIRKILRERRRNKIHKNDEENTVGDETETDIDKEMDDHSNETMATRNTNNNTGNNTNNTSNPVMKITGESRRPSVDSIDSNAISENDCAVEAAEDVDDQQVEHLQKLLSRISTRPSFNSARSDVLTRENQHTCPENFDGANNFGTGEPQEDLDTEEPVMDSVVPLSKVQTNNTNNFIERKRTKRSESFAEELEHVENIDNAGFYKKFMHYLKIYGYGPLKAFAFIRYPPVFLAMMYSGPCFAVLYVQNMTLTYKYSRDPYNFSSVLVGLVYIPNSVTYFIASIWGGKFNDYLLRKKIEKFGVVAPEARFGINVYIAAVLLPISLLITGWCLEYGEQWVTPLIGTAIFGFAQMIVIGVTVTYLADCLPGKGATGIALNNFIRMIMAAGVSFATEPLIKAIGTGVLFSICAGVCAVLSILIVLIIKFGDYWRETYDLEVLYDIVDG